MGNCEGDGPDGGVDGLLDGGGPEGRVGLGILGSEETVCALVDYLLGEGQRVQLVDYLVEVGQRQHFHLLLSLGKAEGEEVGRRCLLLFWGLLRKGGPVEAVEWGGGWYEGGTGAVEEFGGVVDWGGGLSDEGAGGA